MRDLTTKFDYFYCLKCCNLVSSKTVNFKFFKSNIFFFRNKSIPINEDQCKKNNWNKDLERIGNENLERIGNEDLERIGNEDLEHIGNEDLERIGNECKTNLLNLKE